MVAQTNQPLDVADSKPDTGGEVDSLSARVVENLNLDDVRSLNAGSDNDGQVPKVEFTDGAGAESADMKMAEAGTESVEAGDKGAESEQGFSRAVENDDGSRIEFTKLPNGKEVVSTIVHPSGDTTVYSEHDENGNPKKIVDTNKEGIQTAYAERESGNVWTMSNKAINNGQPFKAAGELTVNENGDHTFKNALNGDEFTRKADGTMINKTHQGTQEIKGPDEKLREPADTSKPIDGSAENVESNAEDNPDKASEVSRSVENPDGSRIEFTKLPNGKEVVSTVVRPSGEKNVYENHDADGNPTSVKNFDKDGKQIGSSTYDGSAWTTQHDSLNQGLPFRQVGTLTVGEDGAHVFKDSLADSTFKQEANGRITVTDANGKDTVFKAPDKIERSPEPTDVNDGVPAENIRMIENADGSKIEMTKLPNGNEVVTEVHYPDGNFARFSGHDDSGQPTRVEEYNKTGVRTGQSVRNGEEWTVTNPRQNDGKPYKLPGKFEVTPEGNQVFTHPQDGRKLVKMPSGETKQIMPEETE